MEENRKLKDFENRLDLYEFNEREKWFRQLYYEHNGKFLTQPMTYSEYEELMEEHPDYLDLRDFFRERMVRDISNYELEARTKMLESGRGIAMVKHERYAYTIKRTRDFVEVDYVLSGRSHLFTETQDFWLEPGDVCLLAPNTVHCVSSAADDAIVFAIVLDRKLFNSAFLDIMQGHNILSDFFTSVLYGESASPYILFKTGDDKKIRENVLSMYEEVCRKRRFFEESIVLYFRQIMILLLRGYEMFAIIPNPVNNRVESHITAILGYIEANYKTVTLHELAEFFSYNESYLSRMIRQYTGKTFPSLVGGLQMKKAAALLEETELSLSDIAQEVGCFDMSHFYKKFKKYYGLSPAEYRKEKKHNV